MRSSKGKDGGGSEDDLKVLQNEYKHMQVNRNAFANESELVSNDNGRRSSNNLTTSHLTNTLPQHHTGPTETTNNSQQAESRKRDSQDRCGEITNTRHDASNQQVRAVSAR